VVTKRGGVWYAYFDPFKTRHQVGLKLDVRTEAEAKQIEAMILRACRTDNYSILDSTGREAVMRLFKNQGWKLPDCGTPGTGRRTDSMAGNPTVLEVSRRAGIGYALAP
jgi:hypothetical protein